MVAEMSNIPLPRRDASELKNKTGPLWEEAYAKQGQRLPYLPPEVTARPQGHRPKPTV